MSLSLENLNKSFGDKTVIKNFSYSFGPSGVYAIRGKSGVGKTTLLRIIAGLDKDYTGSMVGGGIGGVSVAFQEYRLFPQLTALQNVLFPNSEAKNEAEVKTLLKKLGFEDAELELFPDQLSGGMKQRVSLARAFLKDAPILLLDEPTKELDPKNAGRVIDLIKENSMSRLVILVSHNDEDISSLGATIIEL